MRTHRLFNNILIFGLIIIAIFALLVRLDIIPPDFLIFNMTFFAKFFSRAAKYLLVAFIVTYISRKHIKNSGEAETAITFVLLASYLDALGNLFGWYSVGNSYSIIWYDNLVHTINPLLYSMGIYIWLKNAFPSSSRLLTALASMFVAFGLGTLFGVAEYYSDIYIGTYMVGGLEDAITDNVYDFIGSLLGFMIIIVYEFYKFEKKK